MTQEIPTPVEANSDASATAASPSSAGAVLRGYREAYGLKLDALASTLRVPVSKLQALEDDRLDLLPDAVFARALALAVCRHLKTDSTPVLALLPGHDVSRLAVKDERGLDSPLHRPSLLPQSSFLVIQGFFSPLRGAAVVVLLVALLLAVWPDIQLGLGGNKDAVPSAPVDVPVPAPVVAPVADAVPPVEVNTGHMVITPVQSAAIAAPASFASGVANGQ